MEAFLFDILKIIATIGLLLGSSLLFIRYYVSQKKQPLYQPDQGEKIKIILPLRLQAYERIVLLLERISPRNLILRINNPEMTALQLQTAMIKAIRDEFDYNLSQQLYISARAWELVKSAKEETISLINVSSGKITENASSTDLAREIIQSELEKEKLPVVLALEEVKKELQKIY